MNSAQKPKIEDLPGKASLLRSAVIAGIGAAAILVTVVLPAEYAIDPTGIGGVIGLTEMGEIKQQLAREAAEDALVHGDQSSSLLDDLLGLFVSAAHAQEATDWQGTVSFTLAPDAFAEIKLVMEEGAIAEYAWVAEGGRINFDLHAHGDGLSIDYDRGRGATSGEGAVEAPFAGEHGWFWRNRDDTAVTITLRLRGDYGEVIETY